ncbi:hypothetical protein HWV62_38160 [Athelia sp. TMB]|nr:hypothetical protein HWV62_38160 [Athelia sp. TMB]
MLVDTIPNAKDLDIHAVPDDILAEIFLELCTTKPFSLYELLLYGRPPISTLPLVLGRSFFNALAASVERWQFLTIYATASFLPAIEQALERRIPWSMPMLEKLALQEVWPQISWPDFEDDIPAPLQMFSVAPKLRHVDLPTDFQLFRCTAIPCDQIERFDSFGDDGQGCKQLLARLPNLVRWDKVSVDYGLPYHGSLESMSHPLKSLDVHFHQEHNILNFFRMFELPDLIDLRVDWNKPWGAQTQATTITFLSASARLVRLTLHLKEVSQDDLRSILTATPGLKDFEFLLGRMPSGIPTAFGKQLLEELTYAEPDPRMNRAGGLVLLPNLRALSLLGQLEIEPAAFTARIRSRTRSDNATSLKIGELAEIKAILGEKADIRQIAHVSLPSPAFPALL